MIFQLIKLDNLINHFINRLIIIKYLGYNKIFHVHFKSTLHNRAHRQKGKQSILGHSFI